MSTQSYRLVQVAALVCGLTLPGVVPAQDAGPGPYVIGSLGRSSAHIGTSPLSSAGVTGITTDEHDTAWKMTLGYQFHRNWAVEAGFTDFGEFNVKGNFGGAAVNGEVDVSAWTLAAVGSLPLGTSNFTLLGRLGVARTDTQGKVAAGPTVVNFDDDSTDLFFGWGIRYDFNKNLGVQFDWERYEFDDRTYLYTLGVRYKF